MSEIAIDVVEVELDQVSAEAVYEMLHDLRGPLVNIKGFSKELRIAARELRQSIDQQKESLAVDVRLAIDDLLENDIVACLNFLESSVQQMDERLDGLASAQNKPQEAHPVGNKQC